MVQMENWRVSFDERYPIYLQIINQFCRSLVKEELHPGERIPSIRDMALILKVNTNTIQRAYQEMERKNLIYSQRGTGYFVMEDNKMINSVKEELVTESTSRFMEEMRALGLSDAEIIKELEIRMKKGGQDNGAVRD